MEKTNKNNRKSTLKGNYCSQTPASTEIERSSSSSESPSRLKKLKPQIASTASTEHAKAVKCSVCRLIGDYEMVAGTVDFSSNPNWGHGRVRFWLRMGGLFLRFRNVDTRIFLCSPQNRCALEICQTENFAVSLRMKSPALSSNREFGEHMLDISALADRALHD